MFVEFGEWLPDLPSYNSPGGGTILNCIPQATHYEPTYDILQTGTTALNARCQGAASFINLSGSAFNFAGTTSKLYLQQADQSFSDVSKVGGYTTATDDNWYFSQFGEKVIATNFADSIQFFDVDSSSLFANLAGTPPKCRYLASIKGFLMLAHTDTSPYQVAWSDFGDPTNWSTGQSGTNTLDAGSGFITQIVGGEYGVIFQERSIYRVTYIGSPAIFQFDQVERDRGVIDGAAGATVKFGQNIFYLGQDGFHVFDGTHSIPVGKNKVNKYFFDNVNISFLYRIVGVHDLAKNIIRVFFPDNSSSDGAPNNQLVFNYNTGRWSLIKSSSIEYAFLSRSIGYTIAGMDTVSATIDGLTYPFGSRFWAGGNLSLAAFTTNHKYGSFDGNYLPATLETTEAELTQGGYSTVVSFLKPMIDGQSNVTVSAGVRNNLSDLVTYTGDAMPNAAGLVPMRVQARYIRARVVINSPFNYAQGVSVTDTRQGYRQ